MSVTIEDSSTTTTKFQAEKIFDTAQDTSTSKSTLDFSVSDKVRTSPQTVKKSKGDYYTGRDTDATIKDLISTNEAANILGVSTSTLKNWRTRKLFGCEFFPADDKRGDTWYYSRERVEQLKAVYQKGILQSMYKLARRFSDSFQKSVSSGNIGNQPKFFTSEEVAKKFGVDEMTMSRWREQKIFQEDILMHNGIYLYAEETVADFEMERDRAKKIGSDKSYTAQEKLKQLQSLPRTPERDEEIIATIRSMCEWKVDRKGKRVSIKTTFRNIRLIFDNDPNIKKVVGFDEFREANVCLGQPPWRAKACSNNEWTDSDDAQLRLYLRENYAEFQDNQLVSDMTIKVSHENAFHAVKDYFTSLPQWDGVERAETVFTKFLRVEDTPFTREITMNWLFGAVARIFHPGCRYQTALVLHGNQKIGKSYVIERLGGKWYMELTDNVEDSHAADAIKKGWLVELKEMAAMRKAEINAVKAFIERSSETRRAAYAHRATTTYRHCVFAITVNDSEFLRDTTGNRRYMILHCNSKMFDYVEGLTDEYITQIWAEVYHKFKAMFKEGFDEKKLSLSRSAELKAEEIASLYLQDDGMAGEIKGYLDRKIPPKFIWQEFTREERRNFIANGFIKLLDGENDLTTRRKARGGNTVSSDIERIEDWLAGTAGQKFVRKKDIMRGEDKVGEEFYIYGSEYREHICAAEIFNECFGNDKRKQMYRINEVLTNLKDWHLGARLRNSDPVYPDQKKPYYRNNMPVTVELQNEDFEGETVTDDNLPF